MKYFLILLLLMISSLYSSEHSSPTKLEKVTLQLHWKYQFEFAGFIAAKEKGFYKDAGLDVTLKEYTFGTDILSDVLEGKSEYGIYNSLSLLEYLRGRDLVLISSYFKRAALVLVTTPDIHSPRDLIGKKIMASTKEDFILNFKPYFDNYGVSIDDLILVPPSYGIEDFAKGKVSAMTAFVSNELSKLDEAGISYNVLDPSDENLYVLQLELITSKKEALKHPKRVKAFKEASIKGWEYALSHKKELADIIYKKYSHKYTKKQIMEEAKGVEKLILPYTYSIGSVDKNFLQKQIALFKKEYNVGGKKRLNAFIFKELEPKELDLTKKEKEFLKTSGVISICLRHDKFPLDGAENGEMVGIMSDIYQKISQKTSLKFKLLESKSSQELYDNVENNRCQMLSVLAINSKRFPNIKPTIPFTSVYFTLISTLDKSFVSSPSLLRGKTLLTQEKIFKEYLMQMYPFLNIKVVPDKNKMMQMLLNKEVYGVFTIDEQVDYLIENYGYGKVKINGFLAQERPIKIGLGVNVSDPILYSIVEKALESISPHEILDIMNDWKMTRYHDIVNYTMVYGVVCIALILLFIMYYLNKKQKFFNKELEKQVNEKTRALREINEHLEETVSQKVDELIQKDKILTIQSKQAVMGEMISMIAHQWRQPLNMITLGISNLQIKQMMHQKIEDEELKKTLDNINETIGYLSETVDDFKTYFHPDKETELVKIDDLLNKAINFVLSRVKSNAIEIGVTEPSSIELKVYPNELIQVLLNILNNAIDAYDGNGIRGKSIDLYTKEQEEMVCIFIKDEAGGISDENLSKLFEPYFSTKGKNGTGLGLYMSQMIIEKQFNGKIVVEVENRSTTFIIQIPTTLSI